jgi:hypothetical protein
MFPAHSAPRSLSRHTSPSFSLAWRDTSSAGAETAPFARRFAGKGLVRSLMAVSSVLSHHALASYLWTPSKQRQIEEVRIERMTISAGARLDDYQVCKPRRGSTVVSAASRAPRSLESPGICTAAQNPACHAGNFVISKQNCVPPEGARDCFARVLQAPRS